MLQQKIVWIYKSDIFMLLSGVGLDSWFLLILPSIRLHQSFQICYFRILIFQQLQYQTFSQTITCVPFDCLNMKMTNKQPICLTRLRKKSTHNLSNSINCQPKTKDECSQQNSGIDSQNSLKTHQKMSKATLYNLNSQRQNLEEIQINCHSNYNRSISSHQLGSCEKIKELEEKLKKMQQQNKFLKEGEKLWRQNFDAEVQQKTILQERINRLEHSLQDFYQEFSPFQHHFEKKNLNICHTQQIKITPDQKQISIKIKDEPATPKPRRLSLCSQPVGRYLPEDPQTKLREYKNQLEIQKIRRVNLQREIKNMKENCRVQLRKQTDAMNRKIQKYRQMVDRKDRQIKEKQQILNRLASKSK